MKINQKIGCKNSAKIVRKKQTRTGWKYHKNSGHKMKTEPSKITLKRQDLPQSTKFLHTVLGYDFTRIIP